MSGCSSNSNGNGGLASLVENAEAYGPEGENLDPVDVDALPDSANLTGQLALSSEILTTSVFVGDATATANFAAGTLTGTASDFEEYETSAACLDNLEGCTGTSVQTLGGSLDIAGTITGSAFDFAATGTLSGEVDDDFGTGEIDLAGSGNFGMDGDQLVAVGTAEGTVTTVADADEFEQELDVEGVLLLTD